MSLVQQSAICRNRREHLSSKLLTYANENRGQEVFDDVILEVDNESVPASRLVLSCYSPFFEKMFKARMKERYQNSVQLSGLDAMSVKTLINFIYTGELIIDGENVLGLLQAADYFQLHDAKTFCFDYLNDRITSENCLVILPAAKLYDNQILSNKVMEHINGHFDDVAKSPEFYSLSCDELMSYITKIDRNQAKESTLYKAIILWTKHDCSYRSESLENLVCLLNPSRFPNRFLEEVVASEELIRKNFKLLNLVLGWLADRMKHGGGKQTEGKILSLREVAAGSKLVELYNKANLPGKDFPELPVVMKSFHLFKLQNYIFCMKRLKPGLDEANQMFRLNLSHLEENWQEVESFDQLRSGIACAVFNDSVVISGGFVVKENELNTCRCFVALLNQWKNLPPMNDRRSSHALVSCNHCLFALGGKATTVSSPYSIKSVEKLNAIGREWEICQPMLTSRCDFAAVCCDGVIYAIGGHTKEGKPKGWKSLRTVEKFDPAQNQWTFVAEMRAERRNHSACVIHGKIFVAGGCDDHGDINHDIACYDPLNDDWSIVGQIGFDLSGHSVIAL